MDIRNGTVRNRFVRSLNFLFTHANDERTSVACLMVTFGLSVEIPVDRPFMTMKVVFVLNATLRKFGLGLRYAGGS